MRKTNKSNNASAKSAFFNKCNAYQEAKKKKKEEKKENKYGEYIDTK